MKTNFLTLLMAVMSAGVCPWVGAYDSLGLQAPIRSEQMLRPVAAAARGERLYVLDEKKSALLIFDRDGKLLKLAGHPGDDKASFDEPQGVALGPDGRVFVADTGNSRIQILDGEGNFLGSFGVHGSDRGRLKKPSSVAVGLDGRVYVADTGNSRVQVFTSEGILLCEFGTKGEGLLKKPVRVEVDAADNVYVLDSGSERLSKFDAAGKFTRSMECSGRDFAIDDYGFFYVLDSKSGRVIEQGPDGAVLGRFGSSGSGAGQYRKPQGIAAASDGTLIILDTGNSRVQKVAIANKLKTEPVASNLGTKLEVSGPRQSWPVPATLLAPLAEDVYAYLPGAGEFVVLDGDGREKVRFGTKLGEGLHVTRGTQGFALSSKSGLYVSDTSNDRLQHFSLAGDWQSNIAESTGFFDSRTKEGRLKDPRGVAVNEAGMVYVANAGNHRVDAFNQEGVFLFSIGPVVGPHALVEPTALAWDKSQFLYFTDKALKKVFKVEPSGTFLAAWGEEGDGPGQFESPASLALDGRGYLYVLDDKLGRVSVFSADGLWMTDFFAKGRGERELSAPSAVAVQGKRLLISDHGRGILVSYDLHPRLAPPVAVSTVSKGGAVTLSWPAAADPWIAGYQVWRSSLSAGPFLQVARVETSTFQDEDVIPYTPYWYQVATIAKTKDAGPLSRPVPVYVTGAFNRPPIEISTIAIGNIFSANYKWYLKNPVGKAVLKNNVQMPFQNLKFSFRLKEFMDFATDTPLERLEPGQSVELPLIATLNNKILEVSEDTPVQAEFTLTYFEEGQSRTISLGKPLRVYSRNAITWENPERIANFITPKDPPVHDFQVEALRDYPRLERAEFLNRNLVTAMHLWDALSEAGVRFQSNPNSPYEALREDSNFPVDYSQFPRETLKRKSGQCDDLATLLTAMLYGANVRAAILDYPGHMALMFDTETADPVEAGLPETDMVLYQGTYWIPLEATMLGKSFPEAFHKALYAYRSEQEKGRLHVIDPRQAWADFEPATLPEVHWTAEVPKAEARQKRFAEEAGALASDRRQFLRKHYEGELREDPKNTDARVELGLLEYQNGNLAGAAGEFTKALAVDPKEPAALNNLGALAFLSGDYARAEGQYLKAVDSDPTSADFWLNLAKTEVKLKNRAKAEEYGQKAAALDASLAPAMETLLENLK